MRMLSEIEKTIERGFRRWTERVFGAAQSDELLLVHRAILEAIEGKVQVIARGKRVFPYTRICVTLRSPDVDRRAVYLAAFAEGGRLEKDVREALSGAGCEVPRKLAVEIQTAESGDHPFDIEYGVEAPEKPRDSGRDSGKDTGKVAGKTAGATLVVVRGKAEQAEYALDKPRINIGRMAELTDSEQRVVRRNDVVFEEGADEANATVSRRHAYIRKDAGEFRIADEGSEFGTRVFRDGRPIEVPSGNRRGEKLRPGDEIYLGRACLRFERPH